LSDAAVGRRPPSKVLRALRTEVAFCCPIPNCQLPYLEYHHFDPPFSERPHHNVEGMIALCPIHHRAADGKTYTSDFLKYLKANARAAVRAVRGDLEWRRRRLLTVAGSNVTYETPVVIECRGERIVWLTRDEDGYLLLNVAPAEGELGRRFGIEQNLWTLEAFPDDVQCSLQRRHISAQYANGDRFAVLYREIMTLEEACAAFEEARPYTWGIEFPVIAVEVTMRVAGSPVDVAPSGVCTRAGRSRWNFMGQCDAAITIG
jgi:hypothetical protein